MTDNLRSPAATRLIEALVRDHDDAVTLARDVDVDERLPILARYARPAHPYGTRARVLECLGECSDARATHTLTSFLEPRPENRELRAQAAELLAERACGDAAVSILEAILADIEHALEIMPALLGAASSDAPGVVHDLQRLRRDVAQLERLLAQALERAVSPGT